MKSFKYLIFILVAVFAASGVQSQVSYTLQLLHASDLEGGVEAITRAKHFAAIVDTLEETYPNSITLSAGDNFIPGPFFNAAADLNTFRANGVFNNVYNRLFGVSTYNGLREEGGRADITIMNIIGFDASAMGNHEFDAGPGAIEAIIEEDFRSPSGPASDRWVGAQFPYLSANLDFTQSSSLGNLFEGNVMENTDFLSGPAQSQTGNSSIAKIAAATYITRGGEKIGVVGATTPLLFTISSPGDVSVKTPGAGTNNLSDLASLIQPWIDSLTTNHGVNKIVLVTHLQQIQLEEQLAALLSGVDIIVAGGSDAVLANAGNRLLSGASVYKPYPILTVNADGDTCAIVSTDGEYSYVGRLVVGFDAAGKLVPSSINPAESYPYIADSAMVSQVWGNYAAAFANPNSKGSLVDTITEAVTSVVISKDGNVLGKTEVYLEGERSSVRTQETNLGNLTADANLWQAQQLDPAVKVSIKNGGGIRASIGEVNETSPGVYEKLPPQANPLSGKLQEEMSQLDAENSLRFNNRLTVLEVTASGLKQLIEHGFAAWTPTATPGQFCQLGGCKVAFDPSLTAMSRIKSLVIVDDNDIITDTIVKDGSVFGNANRPIKIVTLNFLAGGGDGYPFPSLGTNFVDLDTASALGQGSFNFTVTGSEQDALAEYMNSMYAITGFDEEDTEIEKDERIQNLAFRPDGIFPTEVSFANAKVSVSEGDGFIDLSVNYTNNSGSDVRVYFELVRSINTAQISDAILNTAFITATANSTGSANVRISINDDALPESDEIVFVGIIDTNLYTIDGNKYAALFISDNDYTGPVASKAVELRYLSSYDGLSSVSTEIIDYDTNTKYLYSTNSSDNKLEILNISDLSNISSVASVDLSTYGGGINSLAVYNGTVAVAMEANTKTDNGSVVFFNGTGTYINDLDVCVLPDMLTFTHDGKKLLVACEGEPNDDYTVDPEGGIAIIDMSKAPADLIASDVTILDFNAYDSQKEQLIQSGVRIFGPGASVSQDLEPEYIAVSEDNSTAYVNCQEANALIIVNLSNNSITGIEALGYKDHMQPSNGFDSDRRSDDIHIAQAPFRGFYMPDAIASYEVNGINYVVSANEGDSRDYDGYSEEARLDPDDYVLDPIAFPHADAIYKAYGDIKVTTAQGDVDNDGDFDHIYTYGARSFSIWNGSNGSLVYDSGDDIEQILKNHPEYVKLFNVNDDGISIKNRSDDKGPEPEAVTLGISSGKVYAFVGLERVGGVMVYDITDPVSPKFVDIHIPRDTADGSGDQGPEGLVFVEYTESPTGKNLLIASNEVSSTISFWEVYDANLPSGTEELKNKNLAIYPNPASSEVFVVATFEGQAALNIYDASGRLVKSEILNANVQRISLSDLSAGIYNLSLISAEGIDSQKLVLE